MVYRISAIPMTFDDLRGHLLAYYKPLQMGVFVQSYSITRSVVRGLVFREAVEG